MYMPLVEIGHLPQGCWSGGTRGRDGVVFGLLLISGGGFGALRVCKFRRCRVRNTFVCSRFNFCNWSPFRKFHCPCLSLVRRNVWFPKTISHCHEVKKNERRSIVSERDKTEDHDGPANPRK